ncbi:MAG: hypothetical protein HZB33_09940 [Nitrospirae bacterium]|nr:hypothetical protein [Nitrospirota bacterium]
MKDMSTKKTFQMDSDLAGIDKALRRAGRKARELAEKTHTPLYVFENGKVVDLTKQKRKTS